MAKNILIDTGYWYATFFEGDNYFDRVSEIETIIQIHNKIIPWPTLYETLNSQFVGNRNASANFKTLVGNPRVTCLSDAKYREEALALTFESASIGKRKLSLVDIILRQMILDVSLKIDSLVTFNKKDFIDVCQRRGVEILPY